MKFDRKITNLLAPILLLATVLCLVFNPGPKKAEAADFSTWCYPSYAIQKLQRDDNGNVWAVGSIGRIAYFDRGTWNPKLSDTNFNVSSLGSNIIFDLDSNRIWSYTFTSGKISFKYYDILTGNLVAVAGQYALAGGSVNKCVASGNSDSIYIYGGNYVYKFDGQTTLTTLVSDLSTRAAQAIPGGITFSADTMSSIKSQDILYFSGSYSNSGYSRSALVKYSTETNSFSLVYNSTSTYAGALVGVNCVEDEVFAISSPSGTDFIQKFVPSNPSYYSGNLPGTNREFDVLNYNGGYIGWDISYNRDKVHVVNGGGVTSYTAGSGITVISAAVGNFGEIYYYTSDGKFRVIMSGSIYTDSNIFLDTNLSEIKQAAIDAKIASQNAKTSADIAATRAQTAVSAVSNANGNTVTAVRDSTSTALEEARNAKTQAILANTKIDSLQTSITNIQNNLGTDITPPTVKIRTVSGAVATSSSTIEAVLDVSDNVSTDFTYSINGITYSSVPANNIINLPVSSMGPNVINVWIKDQAGNIGKGSITIRKI